MYVSTESANPGTKFGGTWVAFGAGRTLVGVDSSQTEFASVGLTGGEKVHKLIQNELPIISGRISAGHGSDGATAGGYGVFRSASGVFAVDSSKVKQYGAPVSSTTLNGNPSYSVLDFGFGEDEPHNNLQPYITVYMWKRTA